MKCIQCFPNYRMKDRCSSITEQIILMSRFFPVNPKIQCIPCLPTIEQKTQMSRFSSLSLKHKVHLVKSDYRTDYSNESVLFSESKTYSTEPPMESESN